MKLDLYDTVGFFILIGTLLVLCVIGTYTHTKWKQCEREYCILRFAVEEQCEAEQLQKIDAMVGRLKTSIKENKSDK